MAGYNDYNFPGMNIRFGMAAGGDLTGTYPNPTVSTLSATSTIVGGSATNSSITIKATSNGSPSGDIATVQASTIILRGPPATATQVAVGVAGATGGTIIIAGSASGSQSWLPAAAASGTITFPAGTVDFSATGGASRVVKQTSAGGIFTVAQLATTDLSDIGTFNLNTSGTGTFTGNIVSSGYIRKSVSNALTATGTTRADALQLAAQVCNVTTVGANTGVILPASATIGIGSIIYIFNAGANVMKVYGAGSDTIDGTAGSTGVSLTNANRCMYVLVAANTFISAKMGVVSS